MTLHDFSAYRRTMRPILEQNKLLRGSEPSYNEESNMPHSSLLSKVLLAVLLTGLVILGSCQVCHAESIEGHDVQLWANAIYMAENSTSHTYGIMVKYRHTSPRQACINTVRHQYRLWCHNACGKAFVAFLASKYAPLLAKNDPTGLNYNWEKNVSYFLKESV